MDQSNKLKEQVISQQFQNIENDLITIQENLEKQVKQITLPNIILIIGFTGAGKSTVYNWLNQNQFNIIKNGSTGEEQLILNTDDKKNNRSASPQGRGPKSVSKQPTYSVVNGYLLIDLHGFKSTQGWQSQLYLDCLIYEFVNNSQQARFVYIENHPQDDFHNRGCEMQDRIKKLVQQNKIQPSSLLLLLNNVNEQTQKIEEIVLKELDEMEENNQIIDIIKKNLFYFYKLTPKNIQKHSQDKQQRRQQFWQIINNLQPTTVTQFQSENTKQLNEYLLFKSDKFINQLNDFILKKMENSQSQEKLFKKLKELSNKIKKANQQDKLQNLNHFFYKENYQGNENFRKFFLIYEEFFKFNENNSISAYQYINQYLEQIMTLIAYQCQIYDELQQQILLQASQNNELRIKKQCEINQLQQQIQEYGRKSQNDKLDQYFPQKVQIIISILQVQQLIKIKN